LDRLETWAAGTAASLAGAGLLRAVQDALSEASEHTGKPGPLRTAAAHEAASQLALYLRHMSSDFRAIDDLTCQPPDGDIESPAHFRPDRREKEFELWHELKIGVRSYVTLGRRPFRFEARRPAPPWELSNPLSYPEIAKDLELSEGTDVVYRTCYRACAGGPFRGAEGAGEVTRRLNGCPDHPIELWDNDGIVNTASMPWPEGDNILVPADHMDIVGHHKLLKADAASGRAYQSYDLLRSNSGMGADALREIWIEIFDFSLGRPHPERAAGAGGE
ncbi:MAG: hypothetical protein M1436_03965, partial [Acidobacteria bacterium]|nr:hypothetical protein [Acidobacteriota bacterium]